MGGVDERTGICMRRVVITGMGLVTPLGVGLENVWRRLLNGESGAGSIQKFDTADLPVRIACEVPRGAGAPDFNADVWIAPKEQRKVDDFIIFGMAAADQALEDAGWKPEDEASRLRTGVLIGSGIGGLPGIEEASITLHERGPRRISPFFIPGRLINLVSGQVSIRFGFKGPNHAVVTACSTGAHAIGDASRLIKWGDADVMVAGGAEAAICRLGMAGFAACRALSTAYNDEPTRASRPWDEGRDGFVMGEGAGIVVLEELEHAKARGAKIYGEIVGYGATSDGFDMVQPSGEGAVRCMKMALSTVQEPIDYINPHATSTPIGDEREIEAIRAVFGSSDKSPPISATKSLTGHSLGATGVQETIYCMLMMQNGFIPASANIEELDPKFEDMPIVRERRDNVDLDCVLSNSFGFGGTNATLVFQRHAG